MNKPELAYNLTYDKFDAAMKDFSIFRLLKTWLRAKLIDSNHIRNKLAICDGSMPGKMNIFLFNGGVLWISPTDIEAFWTQRVDDNQYFIRTKSGRVFEISRTSWYKILNGINWKDDSKH